MNVSAKFFSIVMISLLGVGCSFFETPTELNVGMVNSLPIKTLVQAGDNAFAGGQPSQVDLAVMKDGEVVEALGMSYHQLEVAGADDLSVANAKQLGALINGFGSEPYFVHCASGNRVGALIAINKAIANGKDVDQAVEIGKQWGLTSLESTVRTVLQSQ
jgi:protein tyrosine phosphatase (PTP) superfamily phosphohydrolase (DUF442 family)